MSPARTAILRLIQRSPDGISARNLRKQLGLSTDDAKNNLKALRCKGLVKATPSWPAALYMTIDRAAAYAAAAVKAEEPPPLDGLGPDPHPFTHRLVSAAEAAPLRPRGPRSVWEMVACA